MDQKDLKAIDNLIKNNLKTELKKGLTKELKPIKEKLDRNTASVMKIEQKINAALELRQDVSEIRTTVSKHEKRLTTVEENLNLTS